MDSFILWVILLHYFAHIFSALPTGSFWFSPVYLCMPSFFFFNSTSLLFGVARCPGPRISHFSNEPWFLLLKNGIINQALVSDETALDVPIATGISASRPSQQMGIYVCVPTHIHIHIFCI